VAPNENQKHARTSGNLSPQFRTAVQQFQFLYDHLENEGKHYSAEKNGKNVTFTTFLFGQDKGLQEFRKEGFGTGTSVFAKT
jgi:hypothetical protein